MLKYLISFYIFLLIFNNLFDQTSEADTPEKKSKITVVNIRDFRADSSNQTTTTIIGECSKAKPCIDGLIIPAWLPPVYEVSTAQKLFRALIYFLALAYLFFGVSIVSDRFMASIEVITSQEKEVQIVKVTGEKVTILVRIWNETVSNLTLMALGSSAPEILLSVIEIFGNNFSAGELGPSTIVGSAAFNLFVIVAICIGVVPSNEIRRIHRIDVFWVTVLWSTFAYVWLFLILSVISPNEVEIWEGVLTFLFFPLTVGTAFWTNKQSGVFGQRLLTGKNISSFIPHSSTPRMGATRQKSTSLSATNIEQGSTLLNTNETPKTDREKYLIIFRKLRAENPDLSLKELERLAAVYMINEIPKSRAFYRIQATRKLLGSGDIMSQSLKRQVTNDMSLVPASSTKPKVVSVGFKPINYICLENIGSIELIVTVDRGSLHIPTIVSVDYETTADTALEVEDFIAKKGTLVFAPDENLKTIEIEIVDNEIYENDEQFHVHLSNVRAWVANNEEQELLSKIDLDARTATVIIIDDDHCGAFSFDSQVYRVAENQGVLLLEVKRHRGARGEVTIPYKFTEGAAKRLTDFNADDGELKFLDGQIKNIIEIEIVNDDEYEKEEEFYVELGEPVGVLLHNDDAQPDGRPILGEHTRAKIIITEDMEFKNFIDKMIVNANTSFMVGSSSWKNQFVEALKVEDLDGDGYLNMKEMLLHYITLPWKLLFSLIPPTDYFNGWLCFCVSIIMIGFLTAIIGDTASLFGCTIGLKDSITAITLIALGTSLPDTFASKTAALQDKTADSSIGNVTGSNAVNVFLGIGIAWALAAIVNAFRGQKFLVNAGGLASSVALFLIGSTICFAVLQWRRYNGAVGAELGGPAKHKAISIGVFLSVWAIYILYSALVDYCVL